MRSTTNPDTDPPAIRLDRYRTRATALRAAIAEQHTTTRLDDARHAMPDVFAAIDRLLELVDEDTPMVAVPTSPLWTWPPADPACAQIVHTDGESAS